MGNRLQNILTFTNIGSGATSAQLHLLQVNGVPLIPDYVEFDNPAFDLSACTSTLLTIINRGGATGTSNVRVVYDHSIERAFSNVATTQLTPAPFVVRGAAATGGFVPVFGKMTKSGAQTIPDLASNLLITFNNVIYDSTGSSMVDVANDRFVIPLDGTYLFTAQIYWASATIASGSFRFGVIVGGAEGGGVNNKFSEIVAIDTTIGPGSNNVSTAVQATAGVFATFVVVMASGAARDVSSGEATIQRVG